MLRRVLAIVLAVAVLPTALVGCQNKVSVQTGERVTCRYGDTIKDTVHTIKVPAAEASTYSVKTSFGLCERHERLLALYAKAQDQIAAGKFDSAKQLLSRVVAGDAAFGQAAAQIAAINAGKKPTPDRTVVQQPTGGGSTSGSSGSSTGGSGSTTGGTKPPASDTPIGPTITLAQWAPATLSGFKTNATAADALSMSRDYVPSPASGSLEAVVIAVEQFSSGKMASLALTDKMRRYDQGQKSEKVAGRNSRFGTDGREFAALGFVNGAMLVIIEGHTQKGVEPAALHDEIVAVAGTLPVK
jgi:hypothetical protein